MRDHADSATHVESATGSGDEILRAYPDLEPEDRREALRHAAEVVRERELPLKSAP